MPSQVLVYKKSRYDYVDAGDLTQKTARGPFALRKTYVVVFDPRSREVRAGTHLGRSVRWRDLRDGHDPGCDEDIDFENICNTAITCTLPRPLVHPSTLICYCDQPCEVLIPDNSNGREQAICATEICEFAVWLDIAHIVCDCDEPTLLLTAGENAKAENFGKKFFKCARSPNNCGYFKWMYKLEFMLNKEWGKRYMNVDEALGVLLELYMDGISFEAMPYDVLSTLVGYCS